MNFLQYFGAFRLPRGGNDGFHLDAGGSALAYNPVSHTLFVSNRPSMVCEVSIPEPVNSQDIRDLPFAEFVQPITDPFEGTLSTVAGDASLIGLLVQDGFLYLTASSYYDANNMQRVGHCRRPLDLAERGSLTPFRTVYEHDRQGFVAGYMAPIAEEWRVRFGAEAITGQAGVPIVTRGSMRSICR